MSNGPRRELLPGPLGLLFLAFPGAFLPLDMVFVARGILAYATPVQAAQIFLYSAALAVLASAVACLAVAPFPGRRRLARTLGVTLTTLAVLHALLLWSQYFSYSLEYQWVRRAAVVALALAGGPLLAFTLREHQLAALHSALRAGAVLMGLAALGCLAIVAAGAAQRAPEAAAAAGAPAGDKPPVFLITVDTLSALYLPMYGYPRPTAPRLAEFARGASLFLRSYANSNFTTPSVNSLMQGARPWTHRALHLEGRPLPGLQARSLPAMLKAAGYHTAAVSTNPWAAPRHLGLLRHFDEISENNFCAAADPTSTLPHELQVAVRSSLVWKSVDTLVVRLSDRLGLCEGRHFDPGMAFAEAREAIARAPAGRPLFLWVHLFPPHDPYVTPAPFLGAFAPAAEARDRTSTTPPYAYEAALRIDFPGFLRHRYEEAIRYVDHHIGEFLDDLKARGLYERSLVIVTADHGESFTKAYGGHGGPALHEELVRVPLLVKEPGQRRPRVVDAPCEQADLLPTVLELLGIDAPPAGEGVSLVPALRGARLERPVFAMNFQQAPRLGALHTGTVAMIEGAWKYVHYFGRIHYPLMPALEDALYDVAADPWETRNRIAEQPEIARRMLEEIRARLARHGRPVE